MINLGGFPREACPLLFRSIRRLAILPQMFSFNPYQNNVPMKVLPLMLGLFLPLSTPMLHAQYLSSEDRQEIFSVLQMQENAWNQGDIKAFMQGYWHSDSLVFIGSKGPSYGWQATYEGYLKRYPDRAAMGELSFEILRLAGISGEVAMVIGRFYLKREAEDLSGIFTLMWKKIEGKWLIISDHTS